MKLSSICVDTRKVERCGIGAEVVETGQKIIMNNDLI